MAEGEQLLKTSRDGARQLSGELRVMVRRLRTIARDVQLLTAGKWWEADVNRAEFSSYCNTVIKLCADHADSIDTHDRLVISKLASLAQMVRENDY